MRCDRIIYLSMVVGSDGLQESLSKDMGKKVKLRPDKQKGFSHV